MTDKKEPIATKEQAESPAAAPTAETPPPTAPAQQPQQVQIDESGAVCAYANFCRVTGTPEELILDFGLNAQPYGTPTEPVQVTQRLVTNYYTAKRMLQAWPGAMPTEGRRGHANQAKARCNCLLVG